MLEKQIQINLDAIKLNRTGFSGLAPYYDLAGIYAFLGNKEKSYYWLDEFDAQNGWIKLGLLFYVKRDGLFDNLRNDQRFKDLMESIEKEEKMYRDQMEHSLKREYFQDLNK